VASTSVVAEFGDGTLAAATLPCTTERSTSMRAACRERTVSPGQPLAVSLTSSYLATV
jgi:hypothetical protein